MDIDSIELNSMGHNKGIKGASMTGSVLVIFTVVHVALSLVGIGSGLVVIAGFQKLRASDFWTGLFLVTTTATSLTGFFFPFKGITPGMVIGIISIFVLALAIVASRKHLRRTFILTVALAEYLNVLIFIVQLFAKTPALREYAPAGGGPIVSTVQLTALLVFAAITIVSIRKPGSQVSPSASLK